MKKYIVSTLGYECCPEFDSIEKAREHLKALVNETMMLAKQRGHKQATKHKIGKDCYRITLGPDKESTLYAHHCIIP